MFTKDIPGLTVSLDLSDFRLFTVRASVIYLATSSSLINPLRQ